MDVNAYLKRINYDGSVTATSQTLRQVHLAHLLTVPFENLSIHSKEPIILNGDALFDKIVVRRRGGFCYELNGLFAGLLRELGFSVSMLSARAANAAGVFGPDFDHMTLLVVPGEDEPPVRWLADVGFGDSFLEPLLLDSPQEQQQGNGSYKIVEDEARLFMMRKAGDEWKSQYSFTLQAYNFEDYSEMCHYHQTSPDSHFTKARICTRATPAGRVTLSEMRLITTTGDERTERVLMNDEEYAAALEHHFGVRLAS
jgi:N-hydroxyarylamine O-acetyltransferase